jgi:hypothetical protein
MNHCSSLETESFRLIWLFQQIILDIGHQKLHFDRTCTADHYTRNEVPRITPGLQQIIPGFRTTHLELQGVEQEVLHNFALPLEEEGDCRRYEVPDEHLVVIEHLAGGRVVRGQRPQSAAAVVDDRAAEQPPRLLLLRRLLPALHRLHPRLESLELHLLARQRRLLVRRLGRDRLIRRRRRAAGRLILNRGRLQRRRRWRQGGGAEGVEGRRLVVLPRRGRAGVHRRGEEAARGSGERGRRGGGEAAAREREALQRVALRAAAEVGDGGGRHWSRRRRPSGVDCGEGRFPLRLGSGSENFGTGRKLRFRSIRSEARRGN